MTQIRSGDDLLRVLCGVDAYPERLDLAAEHGAAAIIHLQCHQSRRELHDVGLESQVA